MSKEVDLIEQSLKGGGNAVKSFGIASVELLKAYGQYKLSVEEDENLKLLQDYLKQEGECDIISVPIKLWAKEDVVGVFRMHGVPCHIMHHPDTMEPLLLLRLSDLTNKDTQKIDFENVENTLFGEIKNEIERNSKHMSKITSPNAFWKINQNSPMYSISGLSDFQIEKLKNFVRPSSIGDIGMTFTVHNGIVYLSPTRRGLDREVLDKKMQKITNNLALCVTGERGKLDKENFDYKSNVMDSLFGKQILDSRINNNNGMLKTAFLNSDIDFYIADAEIPLNAKKPFSPKYIHVSGNTITFSNEISDVEQKSFENQEDMKAYVMKIIMKNIEKPIIIEDVKDLSGNSFEKKVSVYHSTKEYKEITIGEEYAINSIRKKLDNPNEEIKKPHKDYRKDAEETLKNYQDNIKEITFEPIKHPEVAFADVIGLDARFDGIVSDAESRKNNTQMLDKNNSYLDDIL